MPHLVVTAKSAHDFWIFGVSAFLYGAIAFVLLKDAQELGVRAARVRTCRVLGIALEAFLVVGPIALWVEAGQYATWVGQFQEITVDSGVDIRYWLAAVVLANGIAGNLFSATLTY